MSKIIVLIIVFIMYLYGNAYPIGDSILSPTGTPQLNTNTNCDQTAFYGLGTLCQDTDDGEPYIGTGSTVKRIHKGNFVYEDPYDAGNCGSTKTITVTNGNFQKLALDQATCTITLSTLSGKTYPLTIEISSVAGRTATISNCTWPGNTAPTIGDGDNEIITVRYNGTAYRCGANLDYP